MSSFPKECAKLRERLPELAEGVLGGRHRARLESHLASCPRCAAELADLRAVVSALRAMSPDPLPAHVLGSVRREVARRARPIARTPVQRWPRLVLASAAAAVVLAMALAFYLTQGGEGTGRSSLAQKAKGWGGALRAQRLEVARLPSASEAPAGRVGEAQSRAREADAYKGRHPMAASIGKPKYRGPETRFEIPPRPVLPADFSDNRGAASVGPRGGRGDAGRAGGGPAVLKRDMKPGGRAQLAESQERPLRVGAEKASPARRESTVAGLPPASANGFASVASAAGPAGASIVMLPEARQLAITLTPIATPPPGDIRLVMQQLDGRPLILWQGRLTAPINVPIPAGSLGGGPAGISLAIEGELGRRQYVLFLPVLSRLGQTAPSVPAMKYNGEPLGKVFQQLSELSGLVLLVEAPLDRPVYGELPAQDPDTALACLAGEAGFEVASAGEVLRTLTRTKGD